MKQKAVAVIMICIMATLTLSVIPLPTIADTGVIKVGIIQPEGWPQGTGMIQGAEIATSWINDMGPGGGGGITVGGTTYTIELEVGDEHAADMNPAAGAAEMDRLISTAGCKFVYGGFRTECVMAIRDVAMSYKTPYFICGAATNELIDDGPTKDNIYDDVREDYNKYRYLFRNTPINSTSLVYNILGFARYIPGLSLIPMMGSMFGVYGNGTVRTAVIAENLEWADVLFSMLAGGYLGPYAEIVYTARPPHDETSYGSILDDMHALQVRLIIIIFSAPTSIAFMSQYATHPIKAIPVGIDVLGQFQGHWTSTAGGCEYEAFLATVGYRTPLCPEVSSGCSPYTTQEVWDLTVATYGTWPLYTSWGVYDGILGLKETLEYMDAAGYGGLAKAYLDATDVTDPSWDAAALVPFYEMTDRNGVVGAFKYTGPNINMSTSEYDTYMANASLSYLDINPTMKGTLHDVWSTDYLHTWDSGYVRALWGQWQAGKIEVVWPVYKDGELLSFYKRFLFPPRMWPYELDLNYDGTTDMRDISMAARAFGSYPCHPRYDRGAAIIVDDDPPGYEDEEVTMRDISTIARAFGSDWTIPVPY